MAHGLNSILKRDSKSGGIGSRRIFAPHFKLQVLDSYRNDADCKGNQRATARKYGIHRRQIQKWLQVEGTLRNSVEKSDRVSVPRLPDDGPLDFTTPRGGAICKNEAAPMDLSLKRCVTATPALFSPAPPARVPSPCGLPITGPSPSISEHQEDVWDLSTKRKREGVAAPKPVKLFKPYLDDEDDQWRRHSDNSTPRNSDLPPCCAQGIVCDSPYFYNNNNNIICDIKSEYSSTTYTIQELHPKGAPPTPPTYYYPFPSYPEYEISPFYDSHNNVVAAPLKQRHSYSLDFKLSAIECYYQDSVCKGNQRAVATKYNIHRRQVQKWLKQADELRQKNETTKHTEIVR